MKWFFALNQASHEFAHYSEMLKVAVHTASKYTKLSPYFLYDGEENSLTEWLRNKGVIIVPCRTSLYDQLSEIGKKKKDMNYLTVGAGAFLRIEIPRLTFQMGIDDEYVLYTDLDVMFLNEVEEYLEKLAPRFFAVAPEFDIKNFRKMNTGVMLMNLKNLRERDNEFRNFTVKNIERLAEKVWDQTAYHMFYKKWWKSPQWDRLPVECNWKPYWGDYSQARIVHFHGPKPYQRKVLLSDNVPDHLRGLKTLANKEYNELCEHWDKMLIEAEAG